MLTAYPEGASNLIDEAAESEMQAIIDLISRVRNIRSEMNIKPGERIPIVVGVAGRESASRVSHRHVIRSRGSPVLLKLSVSERLDAPKASARAVLTGGAEVGRAARRLD